MRSQVSLEKISNLKRESKKQIIPKIKLIYFYSKPHSQFIYRNLHLNSINFNFHENESVSISIKKIFQNKFQYNEQDEYYLHNWKEILDNFVVGKKKFVEKAKKL